ncbi:AAA family ATPase [Paenibacillus sp. KN14-4R]|uniref:AAA family ATPase n=1 Tax=Paenibacillus sp. KN14-4R TaxID=3445773 RepID=UPI003FA0BCD2
MKIVAIQVDGFGHLRDRSWQLVQSLTLVYGANEAGKSTLMGFIRAILFGFSPRSQLADRYVPSGGGAHGGSLILLDDQGKRVLVERHDHKGTKGRSSASAGTVKVTFEDGTVGGEEALASLLGGMSAEVFRSLFAFGLSELQELRNLQKEEINGYLYSAGLGIPPAALIDGERRLAARLERLYKPRGKNQDINVGYKKLEELDIAVYRSKEQAGRYDLLKQDLHTVDERIEELENNKKSLKEQLDWVETCMKAYEPTLRLQEMERECEHLPLTPEFPEDAIAKWESLQADEIRYRDEYQRHLLKQEELTKQIKEAQPDEQLLAQQVEIEILMGRAPQFQADERSIVELQSELDHEQKELERTLRSIDPSWSEADLQQFALSASMREEITKWKETFVQLTVDQQRETLSKLAISEQVEKLEEQIHLLQDQASCQSAVHPSSQLFAMFTGVPGIQDMKTHLRSISQLYREYNEAQMEYRHLLQRAEDYRLHQEALRNMQLGSNQERDGKRTKRSSRLGAFWMVGGAAVGLGLAVWLFTREETVIAGLLGLLVVVGCLGYYQIVKPFGSKSGSRGTRRYVMDEPVGEPGVELPSDMKFKLSHTEAHLDKLREALSVLVQPLAASAEMASSYTDGTLQDEGGGDYEYVAFDRSSSHNLKSHMAASDWIQVESWLKQELPVWEEGIESWERDQEVTKRTAGQIADWRQDLQSAAKHVNQAEQHVKQLQDEEQKTQLAWIEWLKQYGFTAPLSPGGLLESLPLIEQGHSLLYNKQRLQTRLAAVRSAARDYAAQVDGLLGTAAVQGDPVLGIKRRGEALAHELRKRDAAALASEAQRAAALEAQALSQRLEGLQLRQSELLALASAESELDLRVKARHAQRRAELEGERRHLLPSITALVGSQRLEHLHAMLAEHGVTELAAQVGELQTKLSLLSEEANEQRDRRGRLAGTIEQLENGAGHGDKLQRREEQVAALQALGREYAACAFAAHLLRKAREMYERERQPGVLMRASRYFQEMTQGRFIGVRAPFGENKLEAVKPSGQGVEPAFLSRGTAEQLYLAMRFALAEEYASRAVVPMIMDDILVNFDQQRMECCLKQLQEISGQRQLLLFTCHEHVRDAALRHIPDLQLIEL